MALQRIEAALEDIGAHAGVPPTLYREAMQTP
jgi:hypothetical protein